ncbi:MAG: hypothetical protein GX605_05825, partial [Chloroflexi bacterium]|nr:hypothetical protein [Chloroflexota bacterium]
LLGLASCGAGLWTILSREYQTALKSLSAQATRLGTRAFDDAAISPIIDSAARLIEAISQLVRTAVGVGVFLCITGVLICLAAFWMLTTL